MPSRRKKKLDLCPCLEIGLNSAVSVSDTGLLTLERSVYWRLSSSENLLHWPKVSKDLLKSTLH